MLIAANVHANPLDHGDLVTFPTLDGVTQSIFIESPSPNPPWLIVLFGGTPGDLHLDASGATTLKGNIVIRSAHHWIDWGDAVVLVDTPSDHTEGVDDLFRRSKESFTDTQAVMATLRQRFPNSKIAMVGTSAGTVSVGSTLDRDPTLADAFVLTSPVTSRTRAALLSPTSTWTAPSIAYWSSRTSVMNVCRLLPMRASVWPSTTTSISFRSIRQTAAVTPRRNAAAIRHTASLASRKRCWETSTAG